MNLLKTPLHRKNKPALLENMKQAKTYLDKGTLSKENLERLINIDPTSTRKFVGWMAKQLIKKSVTDWDILKSTIEEYNTFLEKGKAKTKDINQFKTFQDLEKEVEYLNQSGEGVSVKDLESDYDTVLDNSDLLIMSPHTHEASRKIGLKYFSYRDCEDGSKDSAWCTTYKTSSHFNSYYYNNDVTFYYIRIKSESLMSELKQAFGERGDRLVVVALAVLEGGEIDGYDGLDKQMSEEDISKYTGIIGIK